MVAVINRALMLMHFLIKMSKRWMVLMSLVSLFATTKKSRSYKCWIEIRDGSILSLRKCDEKRFKQTFSVSRGTLQLPLPRWMPKITIRILSDIFLQGKLHLAIIIVYLYGKKCALYTRTKFVCIQSEITAQGCHEISQKEVVTAMTLFLSNKNIVIFKIIPLPLLAKFQRLGVPLFLVVLHTHLVRA